MGLHDPRSAVAARDPRPSLQLTNTISVASVNIVLRSFAHIQRVVSLNLNRLQSLVSRHNARGARSGPS